MRAPGNSDALSARAQAEIQLKIPRSGLGQSLLCDLCGNVVHKLLSCNDFQDFVLNALEITPLRATTGEFNNFS